MNILEILAQNPGPVISAVAVVLFLGVTVIVLLMRIRALGRRLQEKDRDINLLNRRQADLQAEAVEQKVLAAEVSAELRQERRHGAERLALLETARDELRLQFQALAQQIFDEKCATFTIRNSEGLDAVLKPFREQLASFRQRIDDIYINDTKERTSLKDEILHLRELNRRINEEAVNLTRALKGDRKLQGTWGELVLERVLEQSGLRKGREYETQGGFRDRDNQLLKPDVVVHLPDGKDIIVDSKVSLSAWEKYVTCDSDEEKQTHLNRHVQAVRDHIAGLAKKDYSGLKGVRSLDFVLMFMPVEASFTAAFESDEQLFSDAFSRKIIVVAPTTLLATLRTIENIWRYEHRNRNAQEIAAQAGILYNKLCGFVEDMERLGKQLGTCATTYDTAMNRLTRGRGNIVGLAERFPELGVKVKKAIPRSIAEDADLDRPGNEPPDA